jgi:hypothetical protein
MERAALLALTSGRRMPMMMPHDENTNGIIGDFVQEVVWKPIEIYPT